MKILLLEKTFKASDIAFNLKTLFEGIQDVDAEIYLFTSTDSKPYLPKSVLDRIAGVQFFENYYQTKRVEFEAINLHKTFPFEKVISFREFDLLRAARIRQHLSLRSLEPENIEIFRDKFLMKTAAKNVGLNVPAFKKVDHVTDLLTFISEVNYPVIIKPRRKAGGLGLKIIRNPQDLATTIELISASADIDEPLDMIAEEFMNANLVHVDGIFHRGKPVVINAGEYLGLQLHNEFTVENYYSNKYFGSLSIESSSEKGAKLINYAQSLMQHFNSKSTYFFHIELWIDKENNVFLNEIAARCGGLWVQNLLVTLYKPALEQCLFKYLCTEDESVFASIQREKRSYGYCGIIPQMPGTIISVPSSLSLSQPDLYRCELKTGDKVLNPNHFYDHMGLIGTLGNTPAECWQRYDAALKEFKEKAVIRTE